MTSRAKSPKPPPSRADILLDVHAALLRDVKPPLPEYDPAVELTIADMVVFLNQQRPPGTAAWSRVSVEREIKALGDTWTSRDVLNRDGRKAQAWRPVLGNVGTFK